MRGWVAGLMLLTIAAWGQDGDAVIGQMYHPAAALATYEVATVKRPQPGTEGSSRGGMTLRQYILDAYGVSVVSVGQVVGGPSWIGTDRYVVEGKASEEQRLGMEKMTGKERRDETRMMQQALLAERFGLKVHFETREMPVYELEVAKGGLKVKEVPAPPPFTGMPTAPAGGRGPMPPGMVMFENRGTVTTLTVKATSMQQLANSLRNTRDVDGHWVLDKTGFKGHFDVDGLRWANLAAGDSGSGEDAPSLFTALQEQLGLKLRANKGMVEVVVIDEVKRPSEN